MAVDETNMEYHVGEYIAVVWHDAESPEEEAFEQGSSRGRKRPRREEMDDSNIEIVDEDNELVNLDDSSMAKVLECRAMSPENVYLRINWLYRPEETEEGRQPWHGDDEVIPSTHMQIIDATTCNGRVDVIKWEPGIEGGPKQRRRYWWRQTLDTIGKETLSSIEDDYCICGRPTDLSKGVFAKDMIQCTSDDCAGWMHTSCVTHAAKAQVLSKIANDESPFENVEVPSAGQKISDPFVNEATNSIRANISNFTAGLVSMVTPSSTVTTPAAAVAATSTSHTRARRRGKGRKKEEDEESIEAQVDHETCQIQLVEVATKKKISVPVTCLFCHQGVKPAAEESAA